MSANQLSLNRRGFLTRAFAFIVFTIGCLGLFGWVVNYDFLTSPIDGFSPIRPISAIAFVAIAVALLYRSYWPSSRLAEPSLTVAGTLVVLIGAIVLVGHFLDRPTLFDRILLPEGHSIAEGVRDRMPAQTAVNFVCVGIALIFSSRVGRLGRLGGFATVAGLAVTYAVILGMLFNSSDVSGVANRNTMAVLSALAFVFVGAALLAVNSECRLFSLFSRDDLGGEAARRLIPVIILVPTCVGWLRVVGQDLGLYQTAFGTALSTFILVGLMFLIVLFYSAKISRADRIRKLAEAELARNEEKLRELFDYSQGMICIHDIDGTLQTVNPAVIASTGYSADEIIGRNLSDFVPEDAKPIMGGYFRQIEHEGLSSGLMQLLAKNGQRLTWRFKSILVSEEGCEPYVIGHASDVTELIATQKKLKEMSLTDELTGLLNRRGFLTLAEQQLRLERHSGTARGLILLFADMDGLKKINDTLGHEAGSEALSTLARIVKSFVRSADLVARWGGDEFVILAVGAGDENIRMMSDRIEESLKEYNATSGKPYQVACSIGVAPVTLGSRSFEDVIAEADQAMYEEKKRRKATRDQAPMHIPSASPIRESSSVI